MQSTLQLKIEYSQIVAQERILYRGKKKWKEDTYLDIDGLYALGAVERNVTRYYAVSTIRWHRRVRFLLAKGKRDETIAPHEHTRWRSPTRACSGGEDTF